MSSNLTSTTNMVGVVLEVSTLVCGTRSTGSNPVAHPMCDCGRAVMQRSAKPLTRVRISAVAPKEIYEKGLEVFNNSKI